MTESGATADEAYQGTQFAYVEAGQYLKINTCACHNNAVRNRFNQEGCFSFNYSFYIVNEESGSYTHHLITTLVTQLTSWLDFDISFVWDSVKNPTASADGTVSEPDDYRLTFSLGVDY